MHTLHYGQQHSALFDVLIDHKKSDKCSAFYLYNFEGLTSEFYMTRCISNILKSALEREKKGEK